ncbi:polymorphic toxin-type HINT domain-containing protein [Dactylosporangium siamense]|uniref:Type IV secretion protein Rhs n=1 Tax=Dactylosporangium siamense TaxID=685454 RepID=A0A919PG54_9ACTN|nr:polymorphic toxin-type HINT domain-containing protein [Dactylosporangium siamense]GIG44236.1 type IV secretion protein Rhs [Dactylosporangium siamense]
MTVTRRVALTVHALAVVLVVSLLNANPAVAAPPKEYQPPAVQKVTPVPVTKVQAGRAGTDPAAEAAKRTRPAPSWPAAGSAGVEFAAVSSVRGTSAQERLAAGAAQRAGALPVTLRPAAGDTDGSAYTVAVLDRNATALSGRDGLLVRLTPQRPGAARTVGVTVDYSGFRNAHGADWANRLRLVRLPECALLTPDQPQCQATPVSSVNDTGHGTVTGQVAVPATTASALSAGASGGAALLALTSGPSGAGGDFGATPLQASATWQAGGSSGDFNWSYPLRVPPGIGGPTPNLGLAYSSQSVDGRTDASNNQPSFVGEGFSLASSGFIERRYKSCGDDMSAGANNTTKSGDLCWETNNASLSMAGHTGELIYNGTDGYWHLRQDDGTRVQRGVGAVNGARDGEYWLVTTPDGTEYQFGLNRLPGWTAARGETKSVQTVPVFGNDPNEPCHTGSFATSSCTQGYRWNLDYVRDTYGNTMSFWYELESGKYAMHNSATALGSYTRSSFLRRVDYGTRTGSEFSTVPFQVELTPADRCETNCGTHGENWHDTPWDLECTGSPCYVGTPTFWSTKRLASVKTQVWNGTGYRGVDQWTLRHTYPDPADTTRAGLWLAGITHTGLASTTPITLPEVVFYGVQMPNRVDATNDNLPLMNWWRVNKVRGESGGEITIEYSAKDCVAGSRVPSVPESNILRCYPVRGTFPGQPNRLDYFHKYLVKVVVEHDTTGGPGDDVVHSYEYLGDPAWHADDDDGLIPSNRKTWSQWRGYERVQVRTGKPGEQTLQESQFYRGMDEDPLPGGGRRQVQLTSSEDGPVDDAEAFAGMLRENVYYNVADMQVVGATINTAWQSAPTASRTINSTTVDARYVGVSTVQTRVGLDGNRGFVRSTTNTTFGDYGLPTAVENLGDITDDDDDTCTRFTYARNTSAWLLGAVSRTETYALPCSKSPATADDVISDTRSAFDQQSWGAAPTRGGVTTEQVLDTWTPGGATYATTRRWTLDDHGRVTETFDGLGRRTTTEYQSTGGGPVTKIVTTNPLEQTASVENDPAWGSVAAAVDLNGKRTTVTYDALGRTAEVWAPGVTDRATSTFAYTIRQNGATVVTTRSLNPAGNYVASYQLYDSLLRERQTQTPSPIGTGYVLTDQFYDSAGRASVSYDGYYSTAVSPGDLYTPANAALVLKQSRQVYDDAGRPVAAIFQPGGTERWRTTRKYGGDRVTTIPPVGGAANTVVTDIKGRTTELWQWPGRTLTGTPEKTTYKYNRQGLVATLTDPANNVWSTTYDIRGRVTDSTDPDTGKTTRTYNADNQVATVKNSLDQTLAFKYDGLGRVVERRTGSLTGPLLASWTYDTLAKGYLTSSTRYDNTSGSTAEYTVAVTGYNDQYQPTGTTVTIPGVETGLAATYTTGATYKMDGSPATVTLPVVGGLALETLTYDYDQTTGMPTKLRTRYNGVNSTLVDSTTFSEYGQLLQTRLTTGTGGSVYLSSTYEADTGRLQQSQVARTVVSPNELSKVTYTYDDNGNIIKASDAPTGGVVDTQCYRQDTLGRITEAWTPSSNACTADPSASALGGPAPYWHSFTYDRSGSRKTSVEHATAAGDVTVDYTVKGTGQPNAHALKSTTTTDNTGTRTANYTYDAAGNTRTRPGTTAGATQDLDWDQEGHLASVTEGTTTTTFLYDADGNRLLRRDAKGTTLYLGSTEIRYDKATATSSGTRYYAHAAGTIAVRTRTGLSWSAADQQGTCNITITAGTNQAKIRRQTPFGGARGTVPTPWPTEKGFVGGDNDPTGLVHLGARDYDPKIGRFISVDPVLDPSDPQQLHGYAYSENNPVNRSDPSGLQSKTKNIFLEFLDVAAKTAIGGLAYASCVAAMVSYAQFLLPFQTAICGAVSSAAVYLSEVIAGQRNFDGVDFVMSFFIGAAWGMGAELAASFLSWASNLIRSMGRKVFGNATDDIAAGLEKEAAARGGAAAAGEGAAGGPKGKPAAKANEHVNAKRGEAEPTTGANTPSTQTTTSGGGAGKGAGKPSTQTSGGGKGCTHSFDPDTHVQMADGSQKAIKNVAVGDEVLATDPVTSETTTQAVTDLHINLDTDLTEVTVVTEAGKTEELKTTAHHPFWSDTTQNWVDAAKLAPGDRLRSADHHTILVLRVHNHTGARTMRDLTVGSIHTYYVLAGNESVLVHNCSGGVPCTCGAGTGAGTGAGSGSGTAGRRGSAATRNQLDDVRDDVLAANPSWVHIAGGRSAATGAKLPERAVRNPGGPGLRFPDLTFRLPDGSHFYVNTVDTYVRTGRPTTRELAAAIDIADWGTGPIMLIAK